MPQIAEYCTLRKRKENTQGKYCKINGINTEGWECLNTYDEKNKIFKAGGDIYTIDRNSFLSN